MSVCGPIQSSSVFVDTFTASVFPISASQLLLTSNHRETESAESSNDFPLHLQPVTPSDSYAVRVKVHSEGHAAVRVVEGVCRVNGVRCDPGERRVELTNGSFIELGTSYRLQYKATPTYGLHPLRILPITPALTPSQDALSTSSQGTPSTPSQGMPSTPSQGTSSTPSQGTPPLPSLESTQILNEAEGDGGSKQGVVHEWAGHLISDSFNGSVNCVGMNDVLRTQLKRIAKEVTNRGSEHSDKRPPPPYEQVGNSVSYQLLHTAHPRVTSSLIDSLYPALKEMELKDHNLKSVYSSFLSSYSTARGQKATPTCMMPADRPVLTFALDMLMHICCMPDMTPLAKRICPLWMDIVSILVTSHPNREVLLEIGGTSRILSCMHLSVMCECVSLQERGWVVLGSLVDYPTIPGHKPAILDASLTIMLSLVAKQLSYHNSHLPLVAALIHTLARLATVAKEATDCEIATLAENESFPTYTPLQGTQVLSTLKDSELLDHMMLVPPSLRSHPLFQDNYCALVKALHPIKPRKVICDKTTPTKPPPKPARVYKLRRSTIANVSCYNHSIIVMTEDDSVGHLLALKQNTVDMIVQHEATPTNDHMTTADSAQSSYLESLHGQRSHSLTLIGRSDHVIHPLLSSDEEPIVLPPQPHTLTSPQPYTLTSPQPHSMSAQNTSLVVDDVTVEEVISKETDVDSHVIDVDSRVIDVDNHVTDVNSHVTNIVNCEELQSDAQVLLSNDSELASHMTSPTSHVTSLIPLKEFSQLNQHSDKEGDDDVIPVDQSDDSSLHRSDTLSRDVQSLLDSLRAPLPVVALESRGRRNSHYFRHSVKRGRSRKDSYNTKGQAVEPLSEQDAKGETKGQSSRRMCWGVATPTSLFHSTEPVSLFEVSGEVLSQNHTLLEEVVSGHNDVITTLVGRTELLEGVLQLWREDKGLQAVTNTLQGCFNEEDSDLPLFMDALNCFLHRKGPWTLAVCCVLLPALKEVVTTQRDTSCLFTVMAVLLSVIERFSELILACKGRSQNKKLSSSIDRQQQMLCYQQLYAIRVAVGNRLDMNSDLKEVSSKLRKLHSVLKPFKNKLND